MDFSISSISLTDLTTECQKLGVPAKLIQGGDDIKIGDYLLNHNLLDQVQKDLGLNQKSSQANMTSPQNTQVAAQGSAQKLNYVA